MEKNKSVARLLPDHALIIDKVFAFLAFLFHQIFLSILDIHSLFGLALEASALEVVVSLSSVIHQMRFSNTGCNGKDLSEIGPWRG